MKNEAKPRVYDILAKAFMQEGVRTCFALLGDANMNWAARLAEQGCRMVYVRHEHCALAAAMAYARKSRRRGRGDRHLRARRDATDHGAARGRARAPAAGGVRRRSAAEERLVQPGDRPGADHHRDGRRLSPPAHARAHAGRGTRRIPAGAPRAPAGGGRHSVRPAGPALGRTGESAEALARAAAAPVADSAASRRRRAAPRNCLPAPSGSSCLPASARSKPGRGAACRALAAKTGGLLSTTLPARGLFHDDPFCIGISGSFTPEVGLEYLKEADFVVAVGCSLAYHAGGGGQLWPKAKMLQIDIDPVAVSQGQEVARHHLRADARLGVEALTAALPARKPSWRSDAMAARIRDSKPDSHVFEIEPGLLDPRDVVEALEKALPRDWEMVNSSGHCSWFFAQMPSRPQEKIPHHPRVRRHRQRHLVRHGSGGGAPGPDRGAVRRRRQPADARAGARDHPAPRAEHPDRRHERRRVRLRSAQAALGGAARGRARCSATAISPRSRAASALPGRPSRTWTACRSGWRSSPRAAAPRSGTSTSRTRSCRRPSAAPIRIPQGKAHKEGVTNSPGALAAVAL